MEFYHVMNCGVDKRNIVLDDADRRRFVRNLFEMNDSNPVFNTSRRFAIVEPVRHERDPLVQIHGWCLMNNHYHLLISELQENGVPRFLQKINMGYSKYFNEKYDRSGALFQGKTKKVLIDDESHYLYILLYIHFNPLDYLAGARDWRVKEIPSILGAKKLLSEYQWCSYRDYLGIGKYSAVITGSQLFETRAEHIAEVNNYFKKQQRFESADNLE
jgi:putative transposase